jgi:hypothetical protein
MTDIAVTLGDTTTVVEKHYKHWSLASGSLSDSDTALLVTEL